MKRRLYCVFLVFRSSDVQFPLCDAENVTIMITLIFSTWGRKVGVVKFGFSFIFLRRQGYVCDFSLLTSYSELHAAPCNPELVYFIYEGSRYYLPLVHSLEKCMLPY